MSTETKLNVNTMTLREFRSYLEEEYTDDKWNQKVLDRVWELTQNNSGGEPRDLKECLYYEYVGLVELSLEHMRNY